jgi:hypothetical protein
MVPEVLRCQEGQEHDQQHVNNVTRVAISESEDFSIEKQSFIMPDLVTATFR